jgi:Domain of unknown function (DUF5050)
VRKLWWLVFITCLGVILTGCGDEGKEEGNNKAVNAVIDLYEAVDENDQDKIEDNLKYFGGYNGDNDALIQDVSDQIEELGGFLQVTYVHLTKDLMEPDVVKELDEEFGDSWSFFYVEYSEESNIFGWIVKEIDEKYYIVSAQGSTLDDVLEGTPVSSTEGKADSNDDMMEDTNLAFVQGNVIGNLYNSGIATIAEDYRYYADSEHLYASINGGESTIIDTGFITQLNAVEDYIYYLKDYQIWKSNFNGQEKEAIYRDHIQPSILLVYGDKIIFLGSEDINASTNLYIIDRDGDNLQQIDTNVDSFAVQDDTLFYVKNESEQDTVYRVKADDEKEALFRLDEISYMQIDGETIYYTAGNSLRKVNLDGSDDQELSPGLMVDVHGYSTPILNGDYVYFTMQADRFFYRISKEGGQPEYMGYPTDGYSSIVGENVYAWIFQEGKFHLQINDN